MKGQQLQIFLAVFAAWGVFVALKAVNSLRTNQPYTFSMLDGGLLRTGKRLTRRGAQAKAVTGGSLGLGCIAVLAGAAPPLPTMYVLMVIAIVGLVVDLSLTDSSA